MTNGGSAKRPKRPLVIDDDEQITALARLSLSTSGLDVETANTAEAGRCLVETVVT